MRRKLYPLKFEPIPKERLWGGHKLCELKGAPATAKVGESWEISGVPGDLSVINNGTLKGRDLKWLIETCKGKLTGNRTYEKYGADFPILIKLIDAGDDLSIQVHPDDRLAQKRHKCPGKTEMWFVMDAEPDAVLYVGFNREVTKEQYINAVRDGTLVSLLNKVPIKPGDAFFIPAGTIHAIGKGCLIAEIQQTSDITYRIDDWGRTDGNGNPRQLHTRLAVDAIDFSELENLNVTKDSLLNEAVNLVQCAYFTTNLVEVAGELKRDYRSLDSFVIYTLLSGSLGVESGGTGCQIFKKGDSVLIPADMKEITLTGNGKLLEIFI